MNKDDEKNLDDFLSKSDDWPEELKAYLYRHWNRQGMTLYHADGVIKKAKELSDATKEKLGYVKSNYGQGPLVPPNTPPTHMPVLHDLEREYKMDYTATPGPRSKPFIDSEKFAKDVDTLTYEMLKKSLAKLGEPLQREYSMIWTCLKHGRKNCGVC